MMKSIHVMACDNPECDTVLPAGDGPGPDGAQGYYIDKGSWHHSSGGGCFTKVFACQADCIASAIDAVFQEDALRKKW